MWLPASRFTTILFPRTTSFRVGRAAGTGVSCLPRWSRKRKNVSKNKFKQGCRTQSGGHSFHPAVMPFRDWGTNSSLPTDISPRSREPSFAHALDYRQHACSRPWQRSLMVVCAHHNAPSSQAQLRECSRVLSGHCYSYVRKQQGEGITEMDERQKLKPRLPFFVKPAFVGSLKRRVSLRRMCM